MKEKEKKQAELDDVMREETRRGRRPIDIEERRRQAQLKRDLRMYLRIATEQEFREAMRALGLRDGSRQLDQALTIWRTFREP
jgi:hypothetical protein